MRKIGLTGGIGAGKSAVSRLLRAKGAVIIDADEAAHAVVEPGERGLEQVCRAFGADMCGTDGRLDRKKLASVVFADKAALEKLNGILHPLIREWMQKKAQDAVQQDPDVLLVYDVPLLIENGLYREMDQVWVVTVPEDIRVERIMLRDHCTREAALARIANQMPEAEKKKYADVLVDNSGDREQLAVRVERCYQSFCGAVKA